MSHAPGCAKINFLGNKPGPCTCGFGDEEPQCKQCGGSGDRLVMGDFRSLRLPK